MKSSVEVSAAAVRRPPVSSPRLGDRLSCHHNPITGEKTRRQTEAAKRTKPEKKRNEKEEKTKLKREKEQLAGSRRGLLRRLLLPDTHTLHTQKGHRIWR